MNNKKRVGLITAISLFVLCYNSYSQSNFSFTYDSGGNQIQRTYLVMLRAASDNANNTIMDSSKVAALADKLKVTIFPNPTKGELKVDISGIENNATVDLNLYSPKGQLLLKQKAEQGLTTINMHSFPTGWYLLKVLSSDEVLNFKIVKE